MKNILKNIIVFTLTVVFGVALPAYGATIILTNSSDTLSTFRTNVNTSLTNLNVGLGTAGQIATSTNETKGQIPFWTTTSGTPATVGSVATSSIGAGTGLTFSGTAGYQIGGVSGTYSVNTSQNIATLSNLTTNGFVITSGGTGTLSVQAFPASIAQGGTNATSFTTTGNGVYFNGTSLLTAPLTSTVTYPYASSTAESATTICFTGDTCRTTWPSSGSYPFTPSTYNGVGVSATTTGIFDTGAIGFIASTSVISFATSTYLSVTGTASTTNLIATSLNASGGVLYGSTSGLIAQTAQGAANTVLIANAGNPAFTSAITVGTSVTSPTINGSSNLQLGGVSINTAGTLSNVPYLNQSQDFTGTLNRFVNASATQALSAGFAEFGKTATTTFTTSGTVGVASTTPWGLLSINPSAGNNPSFAIGSSTATTFAVNDAGGIQTIEKNPATSTTITLNWAKTPQQVNYQIGTASVTITLINATTSQYNGTTKRVLVCNPGTTAGALTWAGAEWMNATIPSQTTTANVCDVWSFIVTSATSTNASPTYKVFGTQGNNFQ